MKNHLRTHVRLPRGDVDRLAQRVEVSREHRDALCAVAGPVGGAMPFARLLLEAVARGELPGLVARVAGRCADERRRRARQLLRVEVDARLIPELRRIAGRAAGSVAAFARLALEEVAAGHGGDAIRVVTDRAAELRAML